MNLISCNEESSNLKQELHLSPPKLPKAGIDNTYNSPTKNNRMSNFLMAQKTNSPHGNGYFEMYFNFSPLKLIFKVLKNFSKMMKTHIWKNKV